MRWGRSFFFQAEDGIRDLVRSRGLGDVYKRQGKACGHQHQIVEADGVGRGFLTFGQVDDLVAPKAARGGEPGGGKDRVRVEKRAIGLEMQDAGGRDHLAHGMTPGLSLIHI